MVKNIILVVVGTLAIVSICGCNEITQDAFGGNSQNVVYKSVKKQYVYWKDGRLLGNTKGIKKYDNGSKIYGYGGDKVGFLDNKNHVYWNNKEEYCGGIYIGTTRVAGEIGNIVNYKVGSNYGFWLPILLDNNQTQIPLTRPATSGGAQVICDEHLIN